MQRFRLAAGIQPKNPPLRFSAAAQVHQCSSPRNIEISTVSLADRSYVIEDRLRGARDGQFARIEGHGKQCVLVKIDQVTLAILPGHILGHFSAAHQRLALVSFE